MSPETRTKWLADRTIHGGYSGGKEQPAHYIWRSMLSRCLNEKDKDYKHYGARGIIVCPRWLEYGNFLTDMGAPPVDMSLDRKDVNGNYELSNCRWATRSQQQKNKTTTKHYTNGAFTGTLVECATFIGIGKELAHWRYKQWSTFEKGVSWTLLKNE